ncbi:hypothetical protein TTHERM_00522070 (macronuclear) [Tetrahymena thermophila SB210]|uniref:Uncharacterized protein n=1 Tax=Tetrahymena thermophila (strain SB210) TaxID=312017 RepID=I7M130_TETTS|nr:hypothetical protein TTHERM_00522070 [Tetrahymena thermophila SB210]EAR94140.2 hypothetical protein TTHERM_00522070 [Tetrahymena thermophila SB210]|eukprot:XP_001014385.2 hypothetical protein TTHERM_00522070 [Tetrahymena thermophila SB210]
MELQELYTSFLPKKAKNDNRQVPAPSQMYLSSNMQKLKLLKMEKDRKKSYNSHLQNNSKDIEESYNVSLNQFQKKKDDIKRSKSFNQSPIKQDDNNERQTQTKNSQNIPFEQYMNMKMLFQKNQQNEKNPQQNIFQNSFLQKINTKEDDNKIPSHHEQSIQKDKIYSHKQSNLSSRNMYQQSIVVLDYAKQNEEQNQCQQNSQNFSQIVKIQEIENQKSKQLDQEHNSYNSMGRQSLDYSQYQKEIEQYKQLERKCLNQRENSPMNIYFQQYSKSQQSHYDKYFPHYQIKIKIPSENSPEQKLGEVMGGKMRSYVPSELKGLDADSRLQISSREKKDPLVAQKFIVNSKIIQNTNLINQNNFQECYENPSSYQIQNNQNIYQTSELLQYQKRGKSSICQRANKIINVQQPISSKVIKPPLSVQAHLNKDNVVFQNLQETTVNGEKQTYIIPLQQNYSVCLNEIDRIKARRKLLFSKRGVSSNGDLQPFSKEESKIQFINKIEQQRLTPKNQIDNFFSNANQIRYIDNQNRNKYSEIQNTIQNNNNSFGQTLIQKNFQNTSYFENNDNQNLQQLNTKKRKHIKSQV